MWTADQKLKFVFESNAIEDILLEQGSPSVDDHLLALNHALRDDWETIPYRVRGLHQLLMRNITPDKKRDQVGNWRDHEVVIGGHLVPVPGGYKVKGGIPTTPFVHLPEKMRAWCDQPVESPSDAWLHHLQFEVIHPFFDGNGRTGRIVWAAERERLGLPPACVTIMNKEKYFQELADWRKWISPGPPLRQRIDFPAGMREIVTLI